MRISTKCSAAIHRLLFLHEYGEKQKVTSGLLALSTGCNPVVIRNIMGSLKKAGIVAVTAGSGGARPLPCFALLAGTSIPCWDRPIRKSKRI